MTFEWPGMLYTLAVLPLVVWLYLRAQRRRRAAMSAAFGGLSRPAGNARRAIPALIFLVSLVVLLVALARPYAQVSLPRIEGTVMLVMDVSGSMAAGDVQPSRMEAARATAKEFILSQPESVQIGIVTFSAGGFAVQQPTNDTNELLEALDRLSPQTGTSLGMGILTALQAIAVDAGLLSDAAVVPTPAAPGEQPSSPDGGILAQLPQGLYPPSVIVVLSDGENNLSLEPAEAAQAAAERGVRVDALGFGTSGGANLEIDGFTVHTALDEATLQQITRAGGGSYYNPQTEPDPGAIYANLAPELTVKSEKMEITAILAGVSMALMAIGAVLSMLWLNYLP